MQNKSAVDRIPSAIIPFSYDTQEIRVIKDESGNPWWVAKDVCDILGLVDTNKAVVALDDDEKGANKVRTQGGAQEMITISESGLYTLIIRSNKPEAKKFRKWVTSEVLPQIRKTGLYQSPVSSPTASGTKFCNKCKQHLSRDFFGKKITNRDGLQPYCKGCTRIMVLHDRERNRRRNLGITDISSPAELEAPTRHHHNNMPTPIDPAEWQQAWDKMSESFSMVRVAVNNLYDDVTAMTQQGHQRHIPEGGDPLSYIKGYYGEIEKAAKQIQILEGMLMWMSPHATYFGMSLGNPSR